MTGRVTLDGRMRTVPFGQATSDATISATYAPIRDEYGAENVLVLTGSPTSMETFRDRLADEVPGSGVPLVSSLIVHATDVVNTVGDEAILSDALRRELVHRFLADRDWETDYFEQASTLESFAGDVAALMETATWQDVSLDRTPELQEVDRVIDEFHAWLDENGHIERGQLLTEALEYLEDPDHRETVVDVDAVLAVEFEEFFSLDRRYLATLTQDTELLCVSERDSSVRRTGMEPGSIDDSVTLDSAPVECSGAAASRPEAVARYLATGELPTDPAAGDVSVLHGESPDEQLDLVADEIERLRERHGWAYDDFAIALKSSGSDVSDTIEDLRQAGIPTESTTVTGFGDDPAIREVLQVARHLATDGERDEGSLKEEVPTHPEFAVDSELLSTIDAEEETLADTLRRWATASGLKSRIAERADPLDARSQFGNVRRAFAMAEFVDDTGFLDATWADFVEMLERAHEHAPTETQTSATDLDGGVRVDHMQALKNGSWNAVFVLNVTDQEYPGDPFLSALFPRERVQAMPDYPGVTDPTGAQVQETFRTESTESSQPLRQYHAEHARRRLAVGANAATERLYFCLYDHEDSALDERVQPSRFLTEAYRTIPWLTASSDETIRSERRAEEFVLSRIDRALADVRRTQSRDVTVSLDELEADLGEIQRLLDESGERGEKLREALRARVDFAEGRVRRE